MYDQDSYSIHAESLKSRNQDEQLRAIQRLIKKLEERGLHPRVHWLDNETPKNLQEYLTEKGITYQLLPPHCNRRNAAERQIRTFKNPFIAILATTDPSFPMHL